MSSIVAAKCPECGGKVDSPEADHCTYCGAVLVRATGLEEAAWWDVRLEGWDEIVPAVKAVVALTGMSLPEAKRFIEECPSMVAEGVDRARAEEIAETLRKAGLVVAVRPAREA